MSCPNLALDRSTSTTPLPPDAASTDPTSTDPASEALAAIASTYEDARAGIISGDSSSPEPDGAARPHPLAATGHSPTVPLTLMTSLKRPQPPKDSPAGPRQAATTWWSRLVRRVEPSRRGRHSATDSDAFSAEAFQWGAPGRVRFLS